VKYLGRFQVEWIGKGLIILDAAHNIEGFSVLRETLDSFFPPDEKFTVLFGCQEKKDANGMLQKIQSRIEQLIPIELPVLRPMPKTRLKDYAEELNLTLAFPDNSFEEQMKAVKKILADGAKVLVCGSAYYLGRIMEEMGIYPTKDQ
jgi:folylpolyglutamate synthase/dihydropteroate synthase